jgi:hypothetical protein
MIYLGYLLLRFQDEEVFNEIETLRLEILKVSTKNKKSFFYRLVFNFTPPLIFNPNSAIGKSINFTFNKF